VRCVAQVLDTVSFEVMYETNYARVAGQWIMVEQLALIRIKTVVRSSRDPKRVGSYSRVTISDMFPFLTPQPDTLFQLRRANHEWFLEPGSTYGQDW